MVEDQKNGYLMVESMVAIMIVTVGLLGIFALLSRSVSLNRVVSDRFVAAYLAAEGIEIVKNLIDNDLIIDGVWNNDIVREGDFELDREDLSLESREAQAPPRFLKVNRETATYGYDQPTDTNFQRVVTIKFLGDGGEIKINSKVSWLTRGGGRFSINLEDHFFNWR